MLSDEQKIILNEFGRFITEQLKEDIRTKRVTKFGAVNSSGNLADSVRYEVTDRGLTVYAEDYILYVNDGRAAGKMPPRDAIKQWIQDKGLSFDIPIDSLAFLIQRKIGKEGTTAWKQGGTNLIDDVISENLIEEIQTAFADDFIKTITSDILGAFDIKTAA